MACPFFVPTQRWDGGAWPHPSRLPLGAGWLGCCSAPGHEGVEPAEEEQREFCNLGYAAKCPRLPVERSCDAVRFSVVRQEGASLLVCFICEAGHLPAAHGNLRYDSLAGKWVSAHADPRIQRLAECFVQSYLSRTNRSAPLETICE